MIDLKIGVLEVFADVAEQYTDARVRHSQVSYVPVIVHDRAKRRWAEQNKDLQRLYDRRYYYRRTGQLDKMPPIKPITQVEIFWDGNGYYYAKPKDSERLGGPFDKLHEAWKAADKKKLEVIRVCVTRGDREYRK